MTVIGNQNWKTRKELEMIKEIRYNEKNMKSLKKFVIVRGI